MNAKKIILEEIKIQHDLMDKHLEPYGEKLKLGKLTTDELLQSQKEIVMYKHTINTLNQMLIKLKRENLIYD